MKRFTLILLLAVFTIACKKEAVQPLETNTEEIATEAKPPCTDQITLALRALAPKLCTPLGEDYIYKGHNMKESDFNDMYRRKWKTLTPDFKKIKWSDIKKLIGTNTCYELYIVFEFDPTATDNESITLTASQCYVESVTKTSFSIPLFRAIERICNPAENGLEFSIGNGKGTDGLNHDMVIFKVTTATNGTEYFDISQVPTAAGLENFSH